MTLWIAGGVSTLLLLLTLDAMRMYVIDESHP
jgi:hypothetical protein